MKKALVCMAMVMFCASAWATDMGSIRGKLTMADGKTPVAGHAIAVFDSQGQPVAKAKTGEKGQFLISSIPTGAYKVAATDNAYAVVQVPALPKVVQVDLALPPQVYGQGVRAGAAGASSGMSKGVVIGVIGGLVVGGIIGGAIGYNSNDGDTKKVYVRTVLKSASPSTP